MIDAIDPVYWESLRNKFKGRRGFVIGNGPSLTMGDLTALKGEITIASNKIYLAFKQTEWRPTFFTIADALLLDKVQHALPENVGTIIAPSGTRKRWQPTDNVRYFKDLGGVARDLGGQPSFSNNIGIGAYAGYTITFFNLQLAAHLGLSEIYLIGCDHSYRGEANVAPDEKVVSTELNHFLPGYRQPGEIVNAAPIDEMDLAYSHARLFSDQSNQKIYNATRGGELDVFERADLDTILADRGKLSSGKKVSVCLPVWNGMPYINECLNSLSDQEFDNFELCVVDGGSNDGTLEAIERFRLKGFDVRIETRAPDGIYNALNAALKMGRGEYLYIMMSDDYLKPNGLKSFVELLDHNTDCALAHSNLEVVDFASRPLAPNQQWVTRPFPRALGDIVGRRHKRRAPFDAIASFCLGTPYTSLTQIMFRRTHYVETGPFSSDFGSFGDLEWQMRSGMIGDTIFTPEILAVWRKHDGQASDINKHRSARFDGMFVSMVTKNSAKLQTEFVLASQAASEMKVFEWYEHDRERVIEHLTRLAPRLDWEDKLSVDPKTIERSKLTIPIGGYENVGMGTSVRKSELGLLIDPMSVEHGSLLDETVKMPVAAAAKEIEAPRLTPVNLDRLLDVLVGGDGEIVRLARQYILENTDLSMRRLEGVMFNDKGIFGKNFKQLKVWQRRRLVNTVVMDLQKVTLDAVPPLEDLLNSIAEAGPVAASYGGPAFAQSVADGDFMRFETSGDSDILELMGAVSQCNLPLNKVGDWLDFGCGVGRSTRALARAGFRTTGYDLSGVMTASAREDFAEADGYEDVTFVNSLTRNQYDGVISLYTFQHLPEVYAVPALRELVSALKPGGVGVVHVATYGRDYRKPATIIDATLRGLHIFPMDVIVSTLGATASLMGVVNANKINSLDIIDNYVILRKNNVRTRRKSKIKS